MKKILLYTHELSYTGAPTSLLRITKVLLRNGYFVEVWSKGEGEYKREFEKLGVEVRIIPDTEIAYNIDRLCEFDLAIANTIVSYKFYDESRKYIPTMWYIREAQNIKGILGQNEYWERIFKSAENLVCVSEYAADYIKENYNRNVEIVHNCVEDFYIEDCNNSEKQFIKILMLGSLTPRKAFRDVVEAYNQLSDEEKSIIKITFAGQIVKGNIQYAEKLIEQVDKNPNIEYLGELNEKEEIMEQYREADVVAIPSTDESCSLVVLEGAMMAKALIVSENVGAKYMVTEDNGWIFGTSNISQLVSVLKDVCKKKEYLKVMGEASRDRYLQLANMDNYEKEICSIVERYLKKGITEKEKINSCIISSQMSNDRLAKLEGIVKKKEKQIAQLNKKLTENQLKCDTEIENLKKQNKSYAEELAVGYLYSLLGTTKKQKQDLRILNRSVFFDTDWYKRTYDSWRKYDSAQEHYLYEGWKIGNDPSPYFSTKDYIEDVFKGEQRECPLIHYEMYGRGNKEKVEISTVANNIIKSDEYQMNVITNSKYFDAEWYAAYYHLNDISEALTHYYQVGWKIGNDPSRKFSTTGYILENEAVLTKQDCPLVHYEVLGKKMELNIMNRSEWIKKIKNRKVKSSVIIAIAISPEDIYNAYNFICKIINKIRIKFVLVLKVIDFPNREKDLPRQLQNVIGKNIDIIWDRSSEGLNIYSAIKHKYNNRDIVLRNNLGGNEKWICDLLDAHSKSNDAIICNGMDYICMNKDGDLYYAENNDNLRIHVINSKYGVLFPKSFSIDADINICGYKERCEDYYLWAGAIKNDYQIMNIGDDISLSNSEYYNFCLNNFKKSYNKLYREIKEKFISDNKLDENKIKLIIPAREINKEYNGDYHYGLAIQRALERKGFEVDFRYIDDWYKPFDGKYAFVLRGSIEYICNPRNINIMWNISHPESITQTEYNSYDKVYVASKPWCDFLNKNKPVESTVDFEVLLQCTDFELFSSNNIEPIRDILFVGMRHQEGRKIVEDILPCEYDFDLYGPGWEKTEASEFLRGKVVENNILSKYYSSSKIVLNDTRPDMLQRGFVPNRIYDAVASSAVVITEFTDEVLNIFGDAVVTYDGTREDLRRKIDKCLKDGSFREKVINEGKKMIGKHTFDNRISSVVEFINENNISRKEKSNNI